MRANQIGTIGVVCVMLFDTATALSATNVALTCERALLAAPQKLAQSTLGALSACENAKRAAKLPAETQCTADAKSAAALAKARTQLDGAVGQKCGGGDRQCGTADDLPAEPLGWPTACPDFEGAGCTNAIDDCAGAATCESCINDAASDRILTLLYGHLAPTDSKTQKGLRRCQTAITKEGLKLFEASRRALVRCWDGHLRGKHSNACPSPGDGKTEAALTAAAAAARSHVCKACGGADGACNGVGGTAVGDIGFVSTCPSVGGCGGTITTLDELVSCITCTSTARAACAVASTVREVVAYPAACGAALPTPNASATPLSVSPPPTMTPSPAGTPTSTGCSVTAPAAQTRVTITIDSSVAVGAASLLLDYPNTRVDLPSIGGGTDVRARVTDLTSGSLFDKGGPNNQDSDNDGVADRVRFTLVAPSGVIGAILRVDFDDCNNINATTPSDYTCSLVPGTVVAADGVTSIADAICRVAVAHSG
ncbi:MAG: hypothetical protein HY271_08440 [Deltaproteobacteria bacterium]|nr:hypothetical protein [Deltaproteobacteria bacterium]